MTPFPFIRKLWPAAALLLSGCMSATPPSTFYSLTPVAEAGSKSPDARISLELVEFPDAIDRPQLVLRTSENTLRLAELHRWAGSIKQDFLQVLTEDLIRITGSEMIGQGPLTYALKPDTRINLSLIRLDGAPEQEAVLKARWSVKVSNNTEVRVKAVELKEPVGQGYGALVAAQSRLISRLAEAMMASMEP